MLLCMCAARRSIRAKVPIQRIGGGFARICCSAVVVRVTGQFAVFPAWDGGEGGEAVAANMHLLSSYPIGLWLSLSGDFEAEAYSILNFFGRNSI